MTITTNNGFNANDVCVWILVNDETTTGATLTINNNNGVDVYMLLGGQSYTDPITTTYYSSGYSQSLMHLYIDPQPTLSQTSQQTHTYTW